MLIQKLRPALKPGQQLVLADSGNPLFSRQGDWDSGSALHCVAMALALLGKLTDPVALSRSGGGPETAFWDRAWPHYLHGLTRALNGEIAAPVLRSGTTRARPMYAASPNASV